MKLKAGSFLKVTHEGANYYFKVTFLECPFPNTVEIQLLSKGQTLTLIKTPIFDWVEKTKTATLDNALLERLVMKIEQRQLT